MMAQGDFVQQVRDDLIITRDALQNSFRRSFFSEVREGLKHLTGHNNMRFIMKTYFLLMAGIGAISCVIIVFVQDAFGTATRDLGFLGVFLVSGLFLGTVLYGRLGQGLPKKKMINLSFVAGGILIAIFTITVERYPNLFIAGLLSGLLGIVIGPIMVSMNTLTHETIPEEVRGRIFSSLEAVIHLGFLVFMFVAAYAAKFIDRFWILIAAGVIFSVCGLAGLFSRSSEDATYSSDSYRP